MLFVTLWFCVAALIVERHTPVFGFGFIMAGGHGTWIWGYSLVNLIAAVCLIECLTGSWLARVLEFQPLRYIGQRSYGFYVWHLLGLGLAVSIVGALGLDSWAHGKFLTIALMIPINTAISWASFRYLEAPFLRLKNHPSVRGSSEG